MSLRVRRQINWCTPSDQLATFCTLVGNQSAWVQQRILFLGKQTSSRRGSRRSYSSRGRLASSRLLSGIVGSSGRFTVCMDKAILHVERSIWASHNFSKSAHDLLGVRKIRASRKGEDVRTQAPLKVLPM